MPLIDFVYACNIRALCVREETKLKIKLRNYKLKYIISKQLGFISIWLLLIAKSFLFSIVSDERWDVGKDFYFCKNVQQGNIIETENNHL